MKNLSPIYDLIRADGSIVTNKNLIFSIGREQAEIYTELIAKYNYFNIREGLTEDGFFFNTVDNLYLDTGYGEKPQRAAIKKLEKLKLIEYKLQGIPPKRYFKVVDNSQLLLEIISDGKNIRENIEKKLLADTETSKLRLLGGIKTAHKEEIKTPNGSVNNTKLNNTKKNNTKERYIALTSNVHTFIKIYCLYYKQMFGKAHMEIKQSNYIEVESWINELVDSGIDTDTFKSEVEEHFCNLSSDGNILVFMESSYRHFEVSNPRQAGGMY